MGWCEVLPSFGVIDILLFRNEGTTGGLLMLKVSCAQTETTVKHTSKSSSATLLCTANSGQGFDAPSIASNVDKRRT